MGVSSLRGSVQSDYSPMFKETKDVALEVSRVFKKKILEVVILIQKVALNFFSKIDAYKAFIIGPVGSLLTAGIVRLSLGKRVPTAGPVYVAVFVGLAVLITVWAVQFFKNPKHKKNIQEKGVGPALVEALPLPKPRVIEPIYSKDLVPLDPLITRFEKPSVLECDPVDEIKANNLLKSLRVFCDFGNRQIKGTPLTVEGTLSIKQDIFNRLKSGLKDLIVFEDQEILKEFISFVNKDEFISNFFISNQKNEFFYEFGTRLTFLLNKTELSSLFPKFEKFDLTLACMDAIIVGNTARVIDLVNTGQIDGDKIVAYGSDEDGLLSLFNYKVCSLNLIQAAVIKGDLESLKKIIGSLSGEMNWTQLDSRGVNLLTLAALSGSKSMWEFVKEYYKQFPKIGSSQYLDLIYAAVKSQNPQIFEELIAFSFEESYCVSSGMLIFDLYEKAIAFNADEIMKILQKHNFLSLELRKKTTITSLIKAAILGNREAMVQELLPHLIQPQVNKPMLFKELYEQTCSAQTPSLLILKAIRELEAKETSSVSYKPIPLEISAESLGACAHYLDKQQLCFVIDRTSEKIIIDSLAKQGRFFQKVIQSPEILNLVLKKYSLEEFLKLICAKEAIKIKQKNSLEMICNAGVGVLNLLPDGNECLLSYAVNSLEPDLIEVILSSSSPIKPDIIEALKAGIATIKDYLREDVYNKIISLLSAKSLQKAHAADLDMTALPGYDFGSRGVTGQSKRPQAKISILGWEVL